MSKTLALVTVLLVTYPIRADVEEKFSSLDPAVWTSFLPQWGSLEIREEELRVTNGARIFSRETFAGPMEVRLKWTHEGNGKERAVADNFMILLHTTGKMKRGMLQDGLRVRVHAGSGLISIESIQQGESRDLATAKLEIEKAENLPAIPEGAGTNWYTIKIVDTGTKLKVSVQDVSLEAEYDPKKLKGGSIGLGKRFKLPDEPDMISYVKQVHIMKLKK